MKTVMVDDSKTVGELLVTICSRIGKILDLHIQEFLFYLLYWHLNTTNKLARVQKLLKFVVS